MSRSSRKGVLGVNVKAFTFQGFREAGEEAAPRGRRGGVEDGREARRRGRFFPPFF